MRLLPSIRRTFLLGALSSFAVMVSADSATVKHLQFDWKMPTVDTPCSLYGIGPNYTREPEYAGRVHRAFLGLTCTVNVPTPEFKSHYRFCALSGVERYSEGRYSCGVEHFSGYTTFTYSYGVESRAAPQCAFVCVAH